MQIQSFLARPGLRRAGQVAGIAILAWGLLSALLWLALPGLIQKQIEQQGSARLGRAVTVGAVDFRPWTLELSVSDLKIAGLAGAPALLEVARIAVDADIESLLRGAPVLDSLKIESPRIRIAHLGEGRYDLDDVLARLAPAPDAAPSEPARFAVYNLELSGGSVDFDDRPVRRVHEVRDLHAALPFLSNLPSSRDVKVTPRLAWRLNGAAFDAGAQATPFAPVRKGEFRFRFDGVDLAPYLGYLPPGMPVRVLAGRLGLDLSLAFEDAGVHKVRLSGALEGAGLRVAQADGRELLVLDRVRVETPDLRPLERFVRLSSVSLQGPALTLRREASGRLSVAQGAASGAGRAPRSESAARAQALASAPPAQVSASAGASAAASPAASGGAGGTAPTAWQVEVDRLALARGSLAWEDDSTRPRARLNLREIALEVSGFSLAPDRPAALQLSAQLGDGARLSVTGSASLEAGTATVALSRLPLAAAGPYLSALLVPSVAGELDARGSASWRRSAAGAFDALAHLEDVTVDRISLRDGRELVAALRRLQLQDVRVDTAQRSVGVARVQLREPRVTVERQADGRWAAERWLRQAAGAAQGNGPAAGTAGAATPAPSSLPPAAAGAERRPAAAADRPWSLALKEFSVDGGQIGWRDALPSRPVSADLSQFRLSLRDVAWPAAPGGRAARLWPLQASARLASGVDAGTLAWKGAVHPQPLRIDGEMELGRVPVHAFEPYLGGRLKVELLHLDASLKAQLQLAQEAAGLRLHLTGDATLEDLRSNTVADAAAGTVAEELLGWKALSVRGLDVALAPDAAPVIAVRETALTDFYARLILSERGRLNLQDLVTAEAGAGTAAAAPASTSAGTTASSGAPAPAVASASGPIPASAAAGAVGVAGPSGAGSAAGTPVIRFGPVALVNGRVRFSDRFIKPNYTAELSDLTGSLSAFSSVPAGGTPLLADLSLRGRAEGTASLEVSGRLNPLARPLVLDIQGRVRDLELPPLTAYSVKYAGHGIERGKLSMDVRYEVQPDGQLQASNRLVLNQLRFGDPVQGAPNSLPVRLAVALLADRNGVIDIDLPIRGSLNDPQFSLGPIIFKVVVNLIVKAVTAPFSLLAAAFGGGGDELGLIPFDAGLAVLGPAATQALDKVAQALQARPGLHMTVVGMASTEIERQAYARARLGQWVLAEKRREAVLAGRDASAVAAVVPDEYPALLKAVYRRADMAKPRNMVGLLKDLPVPEMEALLLASAPVTEDDLRDLALRRGVAVKDYLGAKGLPADRLFLGAAKVVPPEAKWSPRAELSLAAP